LEAPLFIKRFEEVSVKQNETIKLTAKVVGNPVPDIMWLRNNRPLKADNKKIQYIYDGENIELIIKSADSETDSGDYKCIASNIIGKASHGSKVTIDVDKVNFTKNLHPQYSSEENKTITFECETSHTVYTKWYHNSKELSGMDHRVIVEEGRTHKLFIKNAKFSDIGNYVCTVKDQATETVLTVTEAKPDFVRKLQDVEVNEEEIAILETEITSETADVTWYKDGVQIFPDNSRIEYIKNRKIRQLLIKEVTVDDEGEYICVLADQECSAELIVIELPPEIITNMEDLTIAEGEKATFEIELTKGDAFLRWYKNGKEIKFSDHVQLRIDGKVQKLKIYDAVLEDAGEYSCLVGDQISSAQLTVEKPLVEFIKKLPDITFITKDNDAEFVVELSQPNVNVKWYMNNEEIEPTDRFLIIDENKIKKLIIKNAQESDTNTYTCVASNVKTTTKLKVEVIKSAPVINLEDIERIYKVREEEDVTVNIRFNAHPKPEAEWTFEDKTIKTSKKISKQVNDQSAELTIRKVVEEDDGTYCLKLKNVCGEAETSFRIVYMSMYFIE
jgi:hypothetical protein